MKATIFIVLVASVLMDGCRSSYTSTLNSTAATTQAPTTESLLRSAPRGAARDIDERIAMHGSITFRSCDGRYIGMDGDSDLTFYAGGRAHMTEYGFAVNEYRGTYSVSADGIVTAVFPTFVDRWPPLELRRDATSLLLIPAKADSEFIMGNRGGAIVTSGYWPFRPITAEEEKKNPPTPDK